MLTVDRYSWKRTSIHLLVTLCTTPQWGAADAEIKVPSGENTELKRSPFKVWSRSVYTIHATLTANDFFLANFYLPVHSPAFVSKTSPKIFLCWLWLTPVPA